MTMQGVKTQGIKAKVERWGALLLTGAMLAGLLALFPAPAQAATIPTVAATTGWGPGRMWGHGGPMLPGFWLTGEVAEVGTESVTLKLPNHNHAHGMMRNISVEATLAVDESTVLLDNALSPLTLATLQAGDEVVVVPRLAWGNLTARLLYVGTPEDLADASYMGRLVAMDGDTLTLENRDGEFTVLVDADTIWYDEGQVERPAELAEEAALRVLGVEEENEDGEPVILAVLITSLRGL
jgi:hypothetical protein